MFETVLFPINRTRETKEAAELVVKLVKVHNSHLVLLSVVEKTAAGGMDSPEQVANLLEEAKQLFASQGIEAETIEREGMPSFTICDVADEINADVIVMGCRGLGLTEDGASESVTNRAINLSPCPVLVVP